MRIEEDLKLDFDDVLIRPKRSELSSRKDVDLVREYHFKYGNKYKGIPIIAANMDTIGTIAMNKELHKFGLMTALHKHFSIEDMVKHLSTQDDKEWWNTWISLGITEKDKSYWLYIKKQWEEISVGGCIQPKICLDVANGYQEKFVEVIKEYRENYPDATIMAGNVVTADMTEALVLAGADVVKVGIGPGSVCTTRTKTGVGYPQLSAIIECADAAHGLGAHICADGGCRTPGDIAKAFGAGADFIMLGGMLAGHDECGDKTSFYGMSSDTAMTKHNGGVADYRASEGKTVEVPYRGKVENTIKEILGGLRSSCTYVGATKLKELSKRTTFVRVNRQKNDVYGKD